VFDLTSVDVMRCQACEYIRSLEKKPGRNLESLYPAADPAALQLLKNMLMFNPAKRCTAEEALDHDFLKPVRRKEMEVCFNASRLLLCSFMTTHIAFVRINRIRHVQAILSRAQDFLRRAK
jgi:serine/threonine protein kinase